MRSAWRALVLVLATGLAPAAAWGACDASICAGDPCTITGTHTIDHGCRLMFTDQAVTIASTAVLNTANGSWIAIHAKRLTVAGRIRSPGGTVNLAVDTDFDLPAGGLIDISASSGGLSGELDLYARGTATVRGRIAASGHGYGGYLLIQTEDEDIVVSGILEADGEEAPPGDYTIGGDVYLDAGDDVVVDGTLSANARGNRVGDGGVIDVWSWTGDVRVGAAGVVRAAGVDGGSGGQIALTAADTAAMDGTLAANGAGPAGTGGWLEVDGSSTTVTGDGSANGGSGPDASGGSILITSGLGDLTVASTSAMRAVGNGQGGDIYFEGGGNTSVAAIAEATSSAGSSRAGSIWTAAGPGKTLTVSGTFDVRATASNAADGSIFLSGCNLVVLGMLRARYGQHVQGAIVATYTGAFTVTGTGQLTAGSVGGNTVRCTCAGVNVAAASCTTPPACASPPTVQAPATVAPPFRRDPLAVTPCHCDDGAKSGNETGIDCGGPACRKCPAGQPCGGPADCETGICDAGICEQAGCTDAVQNGNESDVDCGGDCGEKCALDRKCRSDDDCRSDYCSSGICRDRTCDDGVLNGWESDVDCGGFFCGPCGPGRACRPHTAQLDCTSGVCTGGVCQQPACPDGVRNGTETDLDCGGPGCSIKCAPGKQCREHADCESDACFGGVCAQATCSDTRTNGTETDQDCGGGPPCPACPDGWRCVQPADCQSQVCAAGECQPPACDDGVKNGLETDEGCGGPTAGPVVCDRCTPGRTCLVPSDCDSGVCTGGVCQAPSCTDGVKNGLETDQGCGGPTNGPTVCPRCTPGRTCLVPSDCDSRVCTGGVCQAPSCTDGIKNGAESDLNCGGPTSGSIVCPRCTPGQACLAPGDCDSGVCAGGVCRTPSCTDGVRNGAETDADCGGGCQPCQIDQGCGGDGDCTHGLVCDASTKRCRQSCGDGVQNGTETDRDCGGACPRCLAGARCTGPNDCATSICDGGTCRCPDHTFTFSIDSSQGTTGTLARWPGGEQTQELPGTGCRVSIYEPDNIIHYVCSTVGTRPFSVKSQEGFSSCAGTGGDDGDGCGEVDCDLIASYGQCCDTRPSCSSALNGVAHAKYFVECKQ